MSNTDILAKPEKRFRAADGIILILIIAAALSLRIFPVYQNVFGSGWINFMGPDPWYHVRLIDNLLQHFPFRIAYDPYTFFPYGQNVWFAPFFDELTGFCAWVIGLGSPSLNTIHTVAAYVPAVLGALVSVPVYFIGKVFFDRRIGLLAALLVGILPGPFFLVSLAGYVDHHVAEILFSTISALFLVLALRQIRENPVSFRNFKQGERKPLAKPLIYAVLSGVGLGVYLLTWVGGLLFVFLFFTWAAVMYIINQLRHESTDYICIIGVPVFLVALIMVVPFLDQLAFATINIVSLVAGILVLPVLSVISRLLESRNIRPFYYPVALVGLGAIVIAVFYFVKPGLVASMLQQFRVFTPDTNLLTVAEVRPLFFPLGPFSFGAYWNDFTTGTFLAPIAFVLILVATIQKVDPGKVFLLIWGLLTFAATLGQVRFAEYLTVVFALLSAYMIWKIIDWLPAILKYFSITPPKETQKEKTVRMKVQTKASRGQPVKVKDTLRRRKAIGYQYVRVGLAVAAVVLLGIYPNVRPAISYAGNSGGIQPDWYYALTWMKENTPPPFEDPDYFNELYTKPAGDRYPYPATAYGVMSWWDFGHYITQIARRIPNSNPNQSGAASAAAYFTSQDEAAANQMLDQLGSKYVMIDLNIAIPFDNKYMTRMFFDVITWADKKLNRYCEIFYEQVNGKYTPVIMYYPEYYYSMSTRLYNFHGQKVVPPSTMVISYDVESGRRLLQSSQTFSTYEQAKNFVDAHPTGNYRIASSSPFISPVPLEKLAHYEQVYQSTIYQVDAKNKIVMPFLEIFRYTP